jgi:hypothetical protein
VSEPPALLASDAERERTVELLRGHVVDGRLTLEEFARRVDVAFDARTREELERLTHDLPAEPATGAKLAPASRRRARRVTIAVFSGMDRKGRWRLARRHWVLSIFGGSDLDLRQAELERQESTIYVLALFGGNDLYVPEGIEVDFRGFGLFGAADEHGPDPPARPGTPFLRVVAVSLFGGTDLWRVPAGATGRRKDLRRAAREAERER